MLICSLKRLVILIFFSFIFLAVHAQQYHFVYLQTENAKPFYVKLNRKVISSSIAGYLILPRLIDSNYNLAIGFAKNEFPEENYTIKIDGKNEGYLLKDFEDKGWGLFNMESYAVTMGAGTAFQPVAAANIQSDPFSKMLATVLRDSTILQKNDPPIIKDSSIKQVDVSEKNDSVIISPPKNDSPVIAASIIDSSKNFMQKSDTVLASESTVNTAVQPLLLSPATRISRKKNKDGIQLVYVDYNMDKDDTIRVFMPYEKAQLHNAFTNNEATKTDSIQRNNIAANEIIKDTVAAKKSMVQDNPAIDTTLTVTNVQDKTPQGSVIKKDTVSFAKNNTADKIDTVAKKDSVVEISGKNIKNIADKDTMAILPQGATSLATNSDCKAFASNEDFLKLRKKMAAENNNDDMTTVAKKVFHSKCFSTEQIKNLSYLFLSDEGKYMFFESAYPFVSDSGIYATLQSQLTDTYYLNRFKAMVNR